MQRMGKENISQEIHNYNIDHCTPTQNETTRTGIRINWDTCLKVPCMASVIIFHQVFK